MTKLLADSEQLQAAIGKAERDYLKMLTAKKRSRVRKFFYEAAREALVEAIDLAIGLQDRQRAIWLYRRLKFMDVVYGGRGEGSN